MKPLRLLTPIAAAVLLTACQRPESTAAADEPLDQDHHEGTAVELFNGESLDGWSHFLVDDAAMADVWSVQDGILVCKGEPMGYLQTKESFSDFHLTVEWRWAPGTTPGNSGILMRVNGEAQALPRSVEVQLKSGNAGDIFGFHGMMVEGDEARKREVPDHQLGGHLRGVSRAGGSEAEPGEWNRIEVELHHGDLVVTLNGEEANRATKVEQLAGPIALQSEGGEIHFRRVTLRPMH